MPKYSKDVARVALYIAVWGLGVKPARLTRGEKIHLLREVDALIKQGHEPQDLLAAARFGMREVWPWTEGRPWDVDDFRKNITKAKAAAAKMQRAGIMPKPASEIREEDV